MTNFTDSKTREIPQIFQDAIDSGKATVRTREPLSENERAVLAEQIVKHKGWLERGDAFKKIHNKNLVKL